jgi:superoxide dismutase
MNPHRTTIDSTGFLEIFEDSFESLDKFSIDFKKKGTEQFGSGWIWLVSDGTKLSLESTFNAENPLRRGKTPLLVCDLWEHAYYIDYRNEREKFLDGFLRHANWEFATSNFEKQSANMNSKNATSLKTGFVISPDWDIDSRRKPIHGRM